MNRRDFLKSIGLAGIALAVPSLVLSEKIKRISQEIEWIDESYDFGYERGLVGRLGNRRHAFVWDAGEMDDIYRQWAKEAITEMLATDKLLLG